MAAARTSCMLQEVLLCLQQLPADVPYTML